MKITPHYLLQNNEQYANEPPLSFKDKNGLVIKAKCIDMTEEEFYDTIIKADESRFKF